MQLLAIVLYSADGARRVVDFKPGALNVVTGESATGKSALLDIFEYCTGRETILMPVGPITDSVSWYAALFELGTTRAFVARPAPDRSRKSSARAMLRVGADLAPLDFEDLAVDIDCKTLRQQLGRYIGITENRSQDLHDRADPALEAHLGHATLLCLQTQSEIASRNLLFHRQDEPYVAAAIRATLPYFLGAVPHDQARKNTQLAAAHSRLKEAESSYSQARRASETVEAILTALWHEAYVLGMVPSEAPSDHATALEVLRDAVTSTAELPTGGLQEEQRAIELQRTCDHLRDQLRAFAADRQLLLSESAAAADFAASTRIPRDRLASLDLLGPLEVSAGGPHDDATTCALCGSTLPVPDPTVTALRHSLRRLSQQLDSIDSIRPTRRAALERAVCGVMPHLSSLERVGPQHPR